MGIRMQSVRGNVHGRRGCPGFLAVALLTEGHHDVRVTPEEIEVLACWIDLQVPFCGDYEEANLWTPENQAKYRHFLEKRCRMDDLERRDIAEWVRRRAALD
jgi:hypothetical protein